MDGMEAWYRVACRLYGVKYGCALDSSLTPWNHSKGNLCIDLVQRNSCVRGIVGNIYHIYREFEEKDHGI